MTAAGDVRVAPSDRLGRFVFGGAQIGGLYREVDDAAAEQALSAAWEAGVRFFDTAPHYGAGLSERRIGRFLRQFPRDSFTLSTKVGRLLVDTHSDTEGVEGFYGGDRKRRVLDYSADGVRQSLEQSLERLGLDRIDVAYIHDADEHMDAALNGACPALSALRAAGALHSFGAGMNASAPLTRFVRESDVDLVMLAGRYTLLDRSAEADLLPACVDRDVAVTAVGVFNSGILADPRPGASYDYADAPPETVARAQRIALLCAEHGVSVRAAALQFPLRHPAVRYVGAGVRTADQLRDNVANLAAPVPPELWPELDNPG